MLTDGPALILGPDPTPPKLPSAAELDAPPARHEVAHVVILLSNILCYCSVDATADLFAHLLRPGGGVRCILVRASARLPLLVLGARQLCIAKLLSLPLCSACPAGERARRGAENGRPALGARGGRREALGPNAQRPRRPPDGLPPGGVAAARTTIPSRGVPPEHPAFGRRLPQDDLPQPALRREKVFVVSCRVGQLGEQ